MLSCGEGLKADKNWMSAETLVGSWCCKRSERYGGRATSVRSFEGQDGKFKPYTPFDRKPMVLFEKFIWREWRCARMLVQDNRSRYMLDSLKASCVL